MDSETPVRRWNLALATFLTWFVGIAVALTPDGLALIEFKSALTTISPLLEDWNASDASPCSWGGINCTDSGRVRNISLSAQEILLEGNISASLGKLEFLEGLMLDQNALSGSIPPELGNLSRLSMLFLHSNNLTGEIPPELGNCSSLRYLSLFDNLLSGYIPEMICKNLNLTLFAVNGNSLSGDITTVLDDLSKLPAIEQIWMQVNNFSGTLPPSIGNATTLNCLSLGFSNAVGGANLGQTGGFGGQIPEELGKLVNLNRLDLGGNNFTGGVPPAILSMSLLNNLDLGQMNLTGEIPVWLGNVTSLTTLLIRSTELYGSIPPSLGKLVNLTWIDLSGNSLTGPIPDSFTSLVNLEDMTLCCSGLTGQIPTNLSKTATSLQRLVIFNNSLSGPIPPDLGRYMPNLSYVALSDNFFNGTLPDGLCEGGSLQHLALNNNSLEGAIPSSLASCASLVRIRIDDNLFTSIPDGFGRNSSLGVILAGRNQLTGQLPRGLGVNSQLTILDLSENRLTGNISILEFSQLAQNLSSLNLANNNFTGEIPDAMGICNLLYLVDLSYNSFTGAVPSTLGNLTSLQELYLQGNKLTLLDPSIYSGFAATLISLNLAENPWNAPIATEIGSLRILQALNLSYGGYTGPVPLELGQLGQLEMLDLSHNNLTGEVPVELGALLSSLTSVNVSFNSLTGSLPPEWVKFLTADPSSFRGNPGLCLHYDANNLCSDVSRPSVQGARAKLKLWVRVIMGVVLGAIAMALLVCAAFHFWRRGPVQEEMVEEKEISEMNLTNEQWSLPFEEIVSATENLSDEHIIGRGAHGVVYKVKCASDARPYIAVKKIVFTDTKTAVPHKTFWAEVKSAGKARHRNLVRLLGFIKRDEVGLLLYDYVPKGDLHSALHSSKGGSDLHLTWEARLRIAKGVACGLAYLHHDYDAPIVHRDIKSSNVLLDDELEAHISDFGLAKVLGMQQGSKRWLSSQNVLGTYGYIAPEAGFGLEARPQLDVYSYGVVLLELLTGKEPSHDPSYGEALDIVAWVRESMQLNEGRVSESVLDPALLHSTDSAATVEMLCVQEIALLCTQKNPADRPTMRDVESMLEALSQKALLRTGPLGMGRIGP